MAVPVSTAPVFRAGSPVALFPSPVRLGGGSLAENRSQWVVSPDGRKFLFIVNAAQSRQEPIILVQNWLEEVRARLRR